MGLRPCFLVLRESIWNASAVLLALLTFDVTGSLGFSSASSSPSPVSLLGLGKLS